MIHQFLILLLVHLTLSKLILTKEQKHLQIEVGQSYQQNVPLLFKKFQHTQLTGIKRQTPYYEKPVCEIKVSQSGRIKQITSIEHNNTNPAFDIRNRIVYKFQELATLRIFIDAIHFQTMFVALYSSNEVVFYSFTTESGVLELQHKVRVLENETIDDARFLVINKSLLLFTPKSVIRIKVNKSFEKVNGYLPLDKMFEDIQQSNSSVYIAVGNQGLVIYSYKQQQNSLTFVSNTTFYYQNGSLSVFFDADKIQIDAGASLIFILDHEEGVIVATLAEVAQNKTVNVNYLRILIGGCQNMIVTAYHIYLTCPQLIQLNRLTGEPLNMSHNTFYPFQIRLQGQRIYIYGHQQLAVYDMYGNVLQEHFLKSISQKSFVVQNFIISFTDRQVTSSVIIPQRQKLYCFTSSQEKEGQYRGSYMTTGLCSEYYFSPQNNDKICQISNPFILEIKNSALVDYKIEIILLIIWISIMIVIGIVYFIGHYIARTTYKQLVEQQTRENIEIVPPIEMKKMCIEEVF